MHASSFICHQYCPSNAVSWSWLWSNPPLDTTPCVINKTTSHHWVSTESQSTKAKISKLVQFEMSLAKWGETQGTILHEMSRLQPLQGWRSLTDTAGYYSQLCYALLLTEAVIIIVCKEVQTYQLESCLIACGAQMVRCCHLQYHQSWWASCCHLLVTCRQCMIAIEQDSAIKQSRNARRL